jgi:hypothetical protein
LILTHQAHAEKFFGESLLFQTRNGVRYRLPSSGSPANEEGESHRDLFLATFAELGLPLSTPLNIATGSFTLRDLLRDSVANFDLQQQEIVWTAVAYCLYLPPQNRWQNRDEMWFTFDDLANELLHRPLREGTCGGAHLLFAMTFLARVDSSRLAYPNQPGRRLSIA